MAISLKENYLKSIYLDSPYLSPRYPGTLLVPEKTHSLGRRLAGVQPSDAAVRQRLQLLPSIPRLHDHEGARHQHGDIGPRRLALEGEMVFHETIYREDKSEQLAEEKIKYFVFKPGT